MFMVLIGQKDLIKSGALGKKLFSTSSTLSEQRRENQPQVIMNGKNFMVGSDRSSFVYYDSQE